MEDPTSRVRIEIQGNGRESYKVIGISRTTGATLAEEVTPDRSSDSLKKSLRHVLASSDNAIWMNEMLARVL